MPEADEARCGVDGDGTRIAAEDPNLVTALRLMRLALPLLDRSGRDLAVAILRHAIDEAEGSQPR